MRRFFETHPMLETRSVKLEGLRAADPCGDFTPSEEVPAVCSACSRDIDAHATGAVAGDEKLRLKSLDWLLNVGGHYSYYGGLDEMKTSATLEHLLECKVAFDTKTPDFSFVGEFAGSYAEEDKVECISTQLSCVCGVIQPGWGSEALWMLKNDYNYRWTQGEVTFQIVNHTVGKTFKYETRSQFLIRTKGK